MRLIWAGLLTLFAVLAVLLAYGVSYAILEDSDPALIKLSGVPLSALFATLAPLSLWAAWRLIRTRLPFWDAVYRPLMAGLALFSILLSFAALAIFVDGIGKGAGSFAAHFFIGTLPLAGMAGIAAWSAYRLVSAGGVRWDSLRTPALAGATLGSASLVLWGVAAPVAESHSDSDFSGMASGFVIVIVTLPSFVLAALGFALVLKLARASDVSIAFGRWATTAGLAGVLVFAGLAALFAPPHQVVPLVPLAFWALSLLAGLQFVRGSWWGTTTVLSGAFFFSAIVGTVVVRLPAQVTPALLALAVISAVLAVRGSWSGRAQL